MTIPNFLGGALRPSSPPTDHLPTGLATSTTLPVRTNNRQLVKPSWIFDQYLPGPGENSCVGHSSTALVRYERALATQAALGASVTSQAAPVTPYPPGGVPGIYPDFQPSRQFVYYNCRALDGTTALDTGTYIGDAMFVLTNEGYPKDSDWPYLGGVNEFQRPPDYVYSIALQNKITDYVWLAPNGLSPDQIELRSCLAAGHAIAFAFDGFDSFLLQSTATSGVIPVPNLATEAFRGAHAMVILDYDDSIKYYWIQNSFGPTWGKGGLGLFPYAYMALPGQTWDHVSIRGLTPLPSGPTLQPPTPTPPHQH